MPGAQHLRWSFTVNNYTEEEYKELCQMGLELELCVYLVLGLEEGEQGTPHIQGYIELVNKKTMGGVKRLPGLKRAHLEVSKGTAEQNTEYCSKEDNTKVFGEPRRQGARNDLEAVKKDIDDGLTMDEIMDKHFRCGVGMEKCLRSTGTAKTSRRAGRSLLSRSIGGSVELENLTKLMLKTQNQLGSIQVSIGLMDMRVKELQSLMSSTDPIYHLQDGSRSWTGIESQLEPRVLTPIFDQMSSFSPPTSPLLSGSPTKLSPWVGKPNYEDV
jgi:hypothetical protein